MSDEQNIFNVGPYVMHGYPVRRYDYTWHIAIFVDESEAQHFVDYANAQFVKHGTTDMAQWDSPAHDEQETS